jgi:PncC family amidohydrolase
MATGAAVALGADVGLALTGVAGPTEQDGQPVGTVWVGLAMDGASHAQQLGMIGGADREQIRQMSTISALDLLRRRLLERGEA